MIGKILKGKQKKKKHWNAISSGKVSLMLPLYPNLSLKYSQMAHRIRKTSCSTFISSDFLTVSLLNYPRSINGRYTKLKEPW